MRTIVEPKQHIAALWSKPEVRDGETFRMMRYVMRVDHDGKVLLHNVVTGQLVVLDQDEAELVESCPLKYCTALEQLVDGHYLIPEWFDEHQQVVNMRKVLWMLWDAQHKDGIVYYTVLPTTACNARCWYCFEQGVKPTTMSEETAEEVVDFIAAHSKGKPITIRWFGGEPTVASARIDQICEGLHKKNVVFSSLLSTNGYLLNEKMIKSATTLWNLKHVTITIDGLEERTNRVKSFDNVTGSPYQEIMRNIGSLLDQEIYVGIRMNLDQENYNDFPDLLKNQSSEIKERFHESPFLRVNVHQIISDYYPGARQSCVDSDEEWYQEKLFELNELSHTYGMYEDTRPYPCLYYHMCEAATDDAITITPEGNLVSCAEQLGDDQIKGNLRKGITDRELVRSWKMFADNDRCRDCVFFPCCASMKNCNTSGRCYRKVERSNQLASVMRRLLM